MGKHINRKRITESIYMKMEKKKKLMAWFMVLIMVFVCFVVAAAAIASL